MKHSSFYDMFKTQASLFVNLVMQNRKDQRLELMKTWADLMATNAKIKSRICPASSDHSKFAMLTNKLLRELANILGDYIVDRRIDKNREKGLIEAFEVYFTPLTNTPDAALSALVYYMAAVKMLADVAREEESLISAKKREVVMAGQILGSKMDSIFF